MPRCNCSSKFIPFDQTWFCQQVAACDLPRLILSDTSTITPTASVIPLTFTQTDAQVPATGAWNITTEDGYTVVAAPADGWYDAWAYAYYPTMTASTPAPQGIRVVEIKVANLTTGDYESVGLADGAAAPTTPASFIGAAYVNASGPLLLKAGQKLRCQGYSTNVTGVTVTNRRIALAYRATL